MDRRAVEQAREALGCMNEALKQINCSSISDVEVSKAWKSFLHNSGLIYSKLTAGSRRHRSQGWWDKETNLRKTDDLLAYLCHARNAAEHGLDVVVHLKKMGPFSISIKGAKWTPESLDQAKSQPEISSLAYDKDGNGLINFVAHFHLCAPVEDRGKVYPVPNHHLQTEFTYSTVFQIGTLVMPHFERLVRTATDFSLRDGKRPG